MKRILTTLIVVATLTGGAVMVIASSGGAPASRTGAPAVGTHASESDCTQCHSGNALNSGGAIEILGMPGSYDISTPYPLTVRITSGQTAGSANRRWGFQLTAVRLDNGDGVGTLAAVSADSVSMVTGDNREYLRQTSSGAKQTFPSPQEWRVTWTSPGTIVGPVAFYVAGIAGNGSGTSGDWVYTYGDTLFDVTPVRTATWGEIKTRYRR